MSHPSRRVCQLWVRTIGFKPYPWGAGFNLAAPVATGMRVKTAVPVVTGMKLHARSPDSFVCEACILGNPETAAHSKLDDRAIRTIFLGYTQTTSQYRLLDLVTKRLYKSRDVRFDETLSYKDIILQPGRVIIPVNDSPDDVRDPDNDYSETSSPHAAPIVGKGLG
jgi:hypothetical protein